MRLQIHLAAQSDQPDVVKLFLEKQPSLVTTATKVGEIVAEGYTVKKDSHFLGTSRDATNQTLPGRE